MKFGSSGRRRVLTATEGLGFSTTVIDFAGSARRKPLGAPWLVQNQSKPFKDCPIYAALLDLRLP